MSTATSTPSTGSNAALSPSEQCETLRRETAELCFLRQLKSAHERGLLALQQATELYGKNSLHLVPYYLLLIEISIHEKQLKQAEELLSLVNWLLVKDPKLSTAPEGPALPDVPIELKNTYIVFMNKLFSLLLMEYEAFPEALQKAAHGAYHCALLFGPEHLYTSELYYCLGLIFKRMEQETTKVDQDRALGMFDKVVDIWYRFLTNPPQETATWMLQHQRLRAQEATMMLDNIINIRSTALGEKHVATGEVVYTQALLFLYLGQHTQAKTLVVQALDSYVENLGADHASTLDVKNVLQQLQDAGV